MVEGRRVPGGRIVAKTAVCRESRSDVIGISGAGKVLLMAGVTVRGCTREDVVHVAGGTRNAYMRAGERKWCLIVIELGAVPCGCVVTGGTGRGEVRSNVIRIGRPGEVCLVASVAIGGQRDVVIAGVALRTCDRYVGAGQWKRSLVVIKRRTVPRGRCVTCDAGCWESDGRVRRAVCVIEVRLMASHAICRKAARIIIGEMTLSTLRGRVRARQRELRVVVVKC